MVELTDKIKARYRYALILLKQLVKTDFKLRYQNSFLGYLWSLLKPLFLFAIMYGVFVEILHVDYGVPHSGVYLLLGVVLWSFFTEMTGGSVGAIVGKGDLLRKLNFPRYVVVLSGSFAAVINLLLNMIVVFIFMAVSRVDVHPYLLLAPFILLEMFILGVALSFFLSAAFVRLRDIGHIWDVVIQALFYATPIFFPLDKAPIAVQKILMLSPLAQTMQDMRYLLVSEKTLTIQSVYGNALIRIVPITLTVAILVLAGMYFKRRSKFFAEEI